MNSNYQINTHTIDIKIHKPMYGSFCYIRELYVDMAIRDGKQLRITIPQGEFLCDPVEWKATGKLMEKVFKRPDEPMRLLGNHVIKLHGDETVAEKKAEAAQERLI